MESIAETIDIGGAQVPPGGPSPLHDADTPQPATRSAPEMGENEAAAASQESLVRISYRQLFNQGTPSRGSLRQTTIPRFTPSLQDSQEDTSVTPAGGLAMVNEDDPEISYPSTLKGTPLYMAPEVLSGAPATRRSDIYSMGALLFELCTGAPPHVNTSLADLQRVVTTLDPPSLSSVMRGVDARFAAIVDRCLHREPSERYASAEELRDALELLTTATQRDDIPEGNPYRGLLPFEAQHRSLFFGRKSEIGTLIDRLRTESFLLVAADSGVGKSSLCRAGILPLVADGALGGGRAYAVAALVPGRKPLQALCSAIATAVGCDGAALLTTLEQEPASLARTLRKQLGPTRGLLLFLDQMEELVTIGDPAQATVVGEALASLSTNGGEVRLLGTARSDFLSRLATLPSLGDDVTRALYLLRPMGQDKLREAVVGPALIKGVSFESDDLVDALVQSTARTDGGLPLLQFALAELWEVRGSGVITTAALDSIGGVAGALARHGDHVVGSLPPAQRLSARRILMSLVTLERTRARRTEEELNRGDPAARPALDALVRGRLLVARDTAEGAAYEVAHEALIRGWDTLSRWLDEHTESRAVKQRLETAAYEWNRLGRAKDALWSARQLAETAILGALDIGPREADFLKASQAARQRSRQIRRSVLSAIPIILLLLYGAVHLDTRREMGRRVGSLVSQANSAITEAQGRNVHVEQLRQQAFALFDAKERDKGEEVWKKAFGLAAEADRRYARAGQTLEAALSLDNGNLGVRALLADTLYERALATERDNQLRQRDDLLQRMALYDFDGSRQQKWNAPAHLDIQTDPPQAEITLEQYQETPDEKRILTSFRDLGATPLADVQLKPGSYLLTMKAPGRILTRYPFVVTRGEKLHLSVPLPLVSQIPSGFAYIPAGRFLFGTDSEDSLRRVFLQAAPLHQVTTPAYLISLHETTFAQWIEFLRAQPKDARERHMPKVGSSGLTGTLELKQTADGLMQLTLQPRIDLFSALEGKPMVYPTRKTRSSQNWLNFPVGGISMEDARAYVSWLRSSGRLPTAYICSEHEWERAAKGADDRHFPHGNHLEPDDANYDQTYQRVPSNFGPDEVGSHPSSRSAFGLDDMAGNHHEWTISSLNNDEFVPRGASYGFDELSLYSNNRTTFDPTVRTSDMGLRICAASPMPLESH